MATQQGDIPVRIIKENKFTFSKIYLKCLTFTLTITLSLMKADIKPVYKKDHSFNKTNRPIINIINNYRPISILSVLSIKLLNAAYMFKFMNILILYYQKFNVAPKRF